MSIKIAVLYVGSSLLAPLRHAEGEINRRHGLGLRVAAHNLGAPLAADEWALAEHDLSESEVVFVIHVTDGENAARLIPLLKRFEGAHRAVVVINCMPELMRRTRMGKLRFGGAERVPGEDASVEGDGKKERAKEGRARRLVRGVGSWMGEQARSRRKGKGSRHTQYLKLVERVPALLRFVPGAGRLRDIKHYLYLFCYFLQPTPANIRSMVLYAIKQYVPDERGAQIKVSQPETMPAVAIYHPDAPTLFESFAAYKRWYERRDGKNGQRRLEPTKTIGLLLMRPQIVSGTRKHYDGLIRAIEAEGLSVLPAISTLMDNREACGKFFVEGEGKAEGRRQKAEGRRRQAVDKE